MGHESQIELWSPNLTTFCFVGFGTDRLRRQEAMKTAGKENLNPCAITWRKTELLGRQLQASLLNQSGWKARKHPAVAEYFFLTFPFIELIRHVGLDGRSCGNLYDCDINFWFVWGGHMSFFAGTSTQLGLRKVRVAFNAKPPYFLASALRDE
jgi:hypothetical protein